MWWSRSRLGVVVVVVVALAAPVVSSADATSAPQSSPVSSKIVFARYRATDAPGDSSAGSRVALKPIAARDSDVLVMDQDGEHVRALTRGPAEDADPAWSSGGNRIAFVRRVGGKDTELFVMSGRGGDITRLTYNRAWEYSPSWSPSAEELVYERHSARQMPGIFVLGLADNNVRRLTSGCSDSSPRWSPSGASIVFTRSGLAPCESGNDEIFVMDSDGSDVRQLTDNPTNDWNPSWSPDGSLIAFERYDCAVDAPPGEPSCTTGEDMELYVMAADGTSEVRLRNNAVDEYWPSWSPDGGWIVFVRDGRRGNLNIFKMRSDGSDVTKLTRGPRSDRSPSWAPG